MTTAFNAVKRHYAAIMAVGGVILIAMGVLLWTNELTRLNGEIQAFLRDNGLDLFSELDSWLNG
jgi:hypothetical protein